MTFGDWEPRKRIEETYRTELLRQIARCRPSIKERTCRLPTAS